MVTTSLPFWMHHPSRTMLPFVADHPADAEARPKLRALPPKAGAMVVDLCPAVAIEDHAGAWAFLAARALEPNPFMEPAFALPAVKHVVPAQRPSFLMCWEEGGTAGPVLVGLLAFHKQAPAFTPVAAAWHHPQWVMSAPLLDRDKAGAALDAILGWLAARRAYRGGLMLQGVPAQGPLMQLLADGGRGRVALLDSRSRAVLRADDPVAGAGPKHDKEMRRQRRRLGPVETYSARSPDEVRVATERFLELEARGWKGKAGTALLADAHLSTFTRTMTRRMAAQGLCRIEALAIDGEAVAMGIVLRSGDRAYYWKTAYDEAYARHSPGKHLAQEIGRMQQADPSLALTDSCAIPNHPMIDALWAGRIEVVDALVACPSAGSRAFPRAAVALMMRKRARQAAKILYHRLRTRL